MILFTGGGKIAEAYKKKYNIKIISARNSSEKKLRTEIKNANVIFHNAALISSENKEYLYNGNVLLTIKLINICQEVNKNIRFIFFSSMSFLDNDSSYLPLNKMSNYAYSKYLAEKTCLNSNLKNITSLRFSTIFYKDQNRDGISRLIYDAIKKKEITIYNNGIATRDIIPINVLIDYLNKITTQERVQKTYNIVSGVETSFYEIVKIILKENPKLNINNILLKKTTNILSNFSSKDVLTLGKININLESEINAYIDSLK